jgi:alpha,alpha-trehalase
MEGLEYGVVGNGRSAALISRKGSIDWLCLPDFDSPSVFTKILDSRKGGQMGIMTGMNCRTSQKYLEHTNILVTSFDSEEGGFDVYDFMPRYRIGESIDHYLPPELYRLIRLRWGNPRFRVDYSPLLNYAKDKVTHKLGPTYIKTISNTNSKDSIFLYSTLDLRAIVDQDEIVLVKDEYLLVTYNQKLIPIDMDRVNLEFNRTRLYWLNWNIRSKKYTRFDDYIERSILVLKLMSYNQTGAVLAALTTSIPEAIGEVRNWDYRFCWIRDASMSIKTLLLVGHEGAAKRFMEFIHSIIKTKNDTFQIMYGIRGEQELTEKTLDHLSGFAGSKPVRIGNSAYLQKQNDCLGYLMDVIYQFYMYFPGSLDEIESMWEVAKSIVRTVCENWDVPDSGIWEIRGKAMNFIHSKVMCWVALDRAIKIAELLHQDGYVLKWKGKADEIKTDVFKNGWKDDIQSFSQTYENNELDASLLLMESYGFISADDERFVKTVKAIKENLLYKDMLFRYKNADDFGQPSTAFTICTFWLVRALFVTGEKEEALRLFEELLTRSNHLKLFSEDLNFDTKKQMGNFPQAYSHLALINTALLFAEEVTLSRFIRP